jgi:hypothetical protein
MYLRLGTSDLVHLLLLAVSLAGVSYDRGRWSDVEPAPTSSPVEPNERGAPDTRRDGRKRRYRAGTTGNRGRFRPRNSHLIWCCSEIVARAILPPNARQRAVYLGNTG